MKHRRKTIGILLFQLLLGIGLLLSPCTALAVDSSVIASKDVEVASVELSDNRLNAFVKAANDRGFGAILKQNSGGIGESPIGYDGHMVKAFELKSNNVAMSSITFSTDKGWISSDLMRWINILNSTPNYSARIEYVLAVRATSDVTGHIWFLPMVESGGTLTVTVPLLSGDVLCGVTTHLSISNSQQPQTAFPYEYLTNETVELAENYLENSKDTAISYSWSFSFTDDMATFIERYTGSADILFDVVIGIGREFSFGPSDVIVSSDAFSDAVTVKQQSDGSWVVKLSTKTFETKKELAEALKDQSTISLKIHETDFDSAAGLLLPIVEMRLNAAGGMNNHGSIAPFKTSSKLSAITVTPADMTVYEGGKDGYEGVVGVDGVIVEGGSDSLPHPLFEISAPKGTSIDPKSLTFSTGSGENAKSWSVESAGGNLYYFVPADNQDPVRVTYTGEDGTPVLTDNFTPSTDLYATYRIDLYPGENNLSEVTASTGEESAQSYPISVNSGTLTVRAVANDSPNNVTFPVGDEPTDKLQAGTASVSAPEGTTYTLNNTDVSVPENGSAISLLFDGIINGEADRTSALLAKVDANADTSQAKYLDLVDANNGNAWVTASGSVTVHWAYPEGTDKNTEFKLWHFPGLHRDDSDGDNSGFDIDDLNNVKPEEVTPLIKGNNALSFSVASGCFSPYVLTWEEKEEPDTPIVVPTKYHTITATAGEGGSISPSGEVKVTEGGSKSFSISADEGYTVGNVTIDGVSYGPLSSYTFSNVQKDHTISVSFMPGSDPANPDDTGVSDWLSTDEHLDYLHGYGDGSGTFGPENQMTRAEVAQMFYNLLLDKSRGDKPVNFADVPADAYYAEPVFTLASLGIVNGTSPETFEPDRPITRAEFVAIAMRFTNGDFEGENLFVDVPEDAWYRDYVVGAVGYGWIYGYQDGSQKFGPLDTITRGQATMVTNRMLWRACDTVWAMEHMDQLKTFVDLGQSHYAFFDVVEATNAHDYTRVGDTRYENWTGLVK